MPARCAGDEPTSQLCQDVRTRGQLRSRLCGCAILDPGLLGRGVNQAGWLSDSTDNSAPSSGVDGLLLLQLDELARVAANRDRNPRAAAEAQDTDQSAPAFLQTRTPLSTSSPSPGSH